MRDGQDAQRIEGNIIEPFTEVAGSATMGHKTVIMTRTVNSSYSCLLESKHMGRRTPARVEEIGRGSMQTPVLLG